MSPRRTAPVERWVKAGDIKLFVTDEGEGEPLVLGHGMWCTGRMFAGLARPLGSYHRLITVDLRAHGRSGVPSGNWSVADVGEDYRRVLDALGIERAVLAGYSMGGMGALHFALAHPERLRGLVLICTTAAAEAPVRRVQITALAALVAAAGAPEWVTAEAAGATFGRTFRRAYPEVVDEWRRAISAMPRKALVQALRAVSFRPSLTRHLGEIPTPTLILAGGRDRIAPAKDSLTMAKRLPHAQLQVVRGASHGLPIERPRNVAALIRRFIRDLVAQRGRKANS
ncbi:MAG: alpha/beta fold hydrolase [Deltaproteobacteria bacterium]